MKQIIEQLRSLNEIDVKLQTVRKDMERLPRELAEKLGPIKLLKVVIERARAEITQLKIEADAAELEVKAGEEALKRLANQMNALKTRKEFDTVRSQMDAQRGWNKDYETKELELMEKIDAKQKEISEAEAKVAAQEQVVSEETTRIEKELAELKARHDELDAQRNAITPGIPEKELAVYIRIAHTRGVAIAHVDGGNCSLCYMRIPAQVQNMALIGKELTCCPSCGRILTKK